MAKERKLGDADEYPPGSVVVHTPEQARAAIEQARSDDEDDEEIERDLDELDDLAGDDHPTDEEARRQAIVTAGGKDRRTKKKRG